MGLIKQVPHIDGAVLFGDVEDGRSTRGPEGSRQTLGAGSRTQHRAALREEGEGGMFIKERHQNSPQ